MKHLLSLLALASLAFAGCAHAPALPGDSCRDDENFVNGKCAPRIPGDGKPPSGIPPWTRP